MIRLSSLTIAITFDEKFFGYHFDSTQYVSSCYFKIFTKQLCNDLIINTSKTKLELI